MLSISKLHISNDIELYRRGDHCSWNVEPATFGRTNNLPSTPLTSFLRSRYLVKSYDVTTVWPSYWYLSWGIPKIIQNLCRNLFLVKRPKWVVEFWRRTMLLDIFHSKLIPSKLLLYLYLKQYVSRDARTGFSDHLWQTVRYEIWDMRYEIWDMRYEMR